MPSPGIHVRRRRIHTPDPRLLSDGRYRSPSPPLEEEAIIAQIVLMFSMKDPCPDPVAVEFLLRELRTVGLPYHVIFNKIDLVEPEVISEWESRLLSWGGFPVSFVSLHSHLGVYDLDKVLRGKSSLILGLQNVGKTSLVQYVTKNRPNDANCELNTVIKKADKWLTEKCDASNIIKEDTTENECLRPYCIDLYRTTRNDAFLVHQKSEIIQKLLKTDPPILDDMVKWVSRMEKAEEYLYFKRYCPETEYTWWRKLAGKKESPQKKIEKEKDYRLREIMDKLLLKIFKVCFHPCEEHHELLMDLLRLVEESPRLCSSLAHSATFIATVVTLMLAAQEPTKIAVSRLLYVFADSHYACKVLIGELGGFHAVTEMIRFGSACAREVGIKLLSVLVDAEENWSKVLVTGVPEVVIGMLAEDGEDALAMVGKVFNLLGSFDLVWNRFFSAAFEKLKDTSTDLYNAVMKALLRIRHTQALRMEYLEGTLYSERDDNLEVGSSES